MILLILEVERLAITKSELELVVFSLIVIPIMQAILYREVLLSHGVGAIWQNIPSQIAGDYYSGLTLVEAFYKIGEIPVLFGLIIIAKYLFNQKDKTVSLFMGFALVIGAMLWGKIIEPRVGMMFLGAILVLLFSFYYTLYLSYVKDTKFERLLPLLKLFLFTTFIFTSIIPSFQLVNAQVAQARWDVHGPALDWIQKNTDEGAVFIADPSQGAMIAAKANRTIIVDSNFLHVSDAQKRVEDVMQIITTPYRATVIDIMGQYRAEYLYIDDKIISEKYNRTQLRFLPDGEDSDCLKRVYDHDVLIIKRTCSLKVIS